ncbi:MAG: hypothetical protein E6R06_17195 [Mycobacterium sp.]|nr:MAG: hypothetical protein E6R06_17195 [Mycobacterium sp.]
MRETTFITVLRIGETEPEQVEVYADDGTPVDPEQRALHMGTPADEQVTVTRAELSDIVAAATAAAVAAYAGQGDTDAVRAAALDAITPQDGSA